MDDLLSHSLVAVIGAGPAGLYAAHELADNGVRVVLFNRDVKPGGLAEYGIYPDKLKMKAGLRKQFGHILSSPLIDYYGNTIVCAGGNLTIFDLMEAGFQALLVTTGAQGTKWLGLDGEYLRGVYHAKDLVYHYNRLPPYAGLPYPIGRRVRFSLRPWRRRYGKSVEDGHPLHPSRRRVFVLSSWPPPGESSERMGM